MAFDATNLKRIHFGGRAMYYYHTTDAIATIVASGYFNGVSAQLRKGDVIVAVDTNVPTVDVLAVTSADAAATVTVQNGT